jgi:hypothetical protein
MMPVLWHWQDVFLCTKTGCTPKSCLLAGKSHTIVFEKSIPPSGDGVKAPHIDTAPLEKTFSYAKKKSKRRGNPPA